MDQTKPHPLESFPGATLAVTLPMTGLEVIIRKLDVEAIRNDGMRTALSLPALREVSQSFAQIAAGEMQKGDGPARNRGELPPEVMLDIEREMKRALIRTALIRPDLDTLVALYGGSLEAPDLGLGPDYSYLAGQIDTFSSPQAGEAEKDAARTFPVSERGSAERSGGKVRGKAK
ncbi:hypothetical protein [Deinococcus humi]|uniref:Uncharacterized protein n=1 Tax=Deinococcus humi TaxID=662880 RepID=A0A7W8JVH5_9DEIO|nr:hypothetical protein [Deinococcus humi]MBB5363995.1 hypothetical protein [Deinococcus humi]GGO32721.1 hypothetical protein GCM10008949_30720 [Deinococcus humi]